MRLPCLKRPQKPQAASNSPVLLYLQKARSTRAGFFLPIRQGEKVRRPIPIQPEKRNSKGQSASIYWAQTLWKTPQKTVSGMVSIFPKSFHSSILPHLDPFHFAFQVQPGQTELGRD